MAATMYSTAKAAFFPGLGAPARVCCCLVESALVILTSCAFQWVFHNPWCNIMFACGCTWNWDGGWDECNVHDVTNKYRCPLCMANKWTAWTTTWLVLALMVLTYYVVLLSAYRKERRLKRKRTERLDVEEGGDEVINGHEVQGRSALISAVTFIVVRLTSLFVCLASFFFFFTGVSFFFFLFNDYPHFFFGRDVNT
eukprot:TRINITY_DN11192_c0_g1_i1.p1 TRINITY_DN11192_c0_g1~~TRINITY_DN11192_c0_g1_i1.p1  ORF type:complete len:197 (-),score=40.08 TRINITY_DN11192_c0_g1_i1:102-692(-)